MNRRALILTLILSALLALAACTTADDDATDDAPDEEPTPTEMVTDDTATDDGADDAADDVDPAADDATAQDDEVTEFADEEELEEAIEEGEISLYPPDGFLNVGDGEEHESAWGAYFWVHDPTGLAVEVTPPFFEFDEFEPAAVSSGDEIEFSFDFDDYDPEQMTVKVYDLDDAGEIEDNQILISWEPIEEHELDEGEFTWTADLDAGEYFIVVNTIWPTDMDAWHRAQEVDYRWWVEVE